MKNYLLGALLLLCSIAYAQIDKITYPANGSIFQQDGSGHYSFSFGGTTRKESGLPNLRYSLYKIDSDNMFSIIYNDVEIPSSNTKTNIDGRVVFSFKNINLEKGWYQLFLFSVTLVSH